MEAQPKPGITAKQKRVLKLFLDAVMLVLLALMYQKQVVSMEFHEIGGLALIGLFLIHHLANGKWIGAATRRLFAKGTPGIVLARYLVAALLLVAFLTIGVTGVFISKVVFSLHIAGNFKALHTFASALAVLLMGVHLGLHADYIFGKLLRPGANRTAKVALCMVLTALIAFGGYSLTSTSFLRYLVAPFQTTNAMQGVPSPSGEIALDGSSENHPFDLSELPEFSAENGAQPPQGGENGTPPANGGNRDGKGGGFGGGEGRGEGGGPGESTSAALLIAQYVGIIALFGAVTYGVLRLTGRRKAKNSTGIAVSGEDALSDE